VPLVGLVVGILGFTIIIGIGIVLVPIWWIVADTVKLVALRKDLSGAAYAP
jgi:hypothetical protein